MEEAEDQDAVEARRNLYLGQALEELHSYETRLSDPKWKRVNYNGDVGISCYELASEEHGYTLKAEGVVEGKTADKIAAAHRDCNHISRCSWDGADITDIGLLETVREAKTADYEAYINIQYAEHNAGIPGVATREFVYLEFSQSQRSAANANDRHWTILARYTDHPKRPVRDVPVRALSRTIMMAKPLDPRVDDGLLQIPRTAVTIVAWVDPGGNVPASVIKLYKTKLADRIKFLRKTQFV